MNRLVGDLLELTRTRMGDSIPITRASTDVGQLLEDVADEMSASHPTHQLKVRKSGNLHGMWDCERLMQAMINLVSNAVHHGAGDRPITIAAAGTPEEIVITVHNNGEPISTDRIDHLFDAMKELQPGGVRDRRHLGLGLYIVDKIVAAHKGRVDVASSAAEGTMFTLHLPRAI
jgi:signal transduction histidine kinase